MASTIQKLSYNIEDKFAPIPANEKALQTISAMPFIKASDDFEQLEGLCFDREGNLYFVGVFTGHVFKVEMETKKISIIYTAPEGYSPAALKIHKDGRLFLACLGNFNDTGCVFAVQPDGSGFEMIVPPEKGFLIDDLVFDSKGGFYFTDFKGYCSQLDGGIYYVSPDFQTITPVLKNMAVPNGIALTTNEEALWVTEMSQNRLLFIELAEDGVTIPPFGTSVPYYFTGFDGPDSCCIDSEDNVYVAMYQQGRYLVFNKFGYPIGQILIPGREEGHMMRSTHPYLRPGTDEVYVCANDYTNGGGSWIYVARGFAEAHKSYQFQ